MINLLDAVAADVFLTWLNSQRDAHYHLEGLESHAGLLVASDQERRLALSVGLLFDDGDEAWQRGRDSIAAKLRAAGAGPLALWVPPDADLPGEDLTAFVQHVAEAASPLTPGQRGQAEFPVTLTLRRLSDEGSYVRVTGGLAPHWAKLTGRIFGTYDLDTRAIHRLPEPESRLSETLDWVVLLGNGMKQGAASSFKGEDAWTVTRPSQGDLTALIGAPPRSDPSNGTMVRKLLRQALRNGTAGLPSDTGAQRALVLLGIFRSMQEENALIALRSCEPSLFTGYDMVCLVADGLCKPLFVKGGHTLPASI